MLLRETARDHDRLRGLLFIAFGLEYNETKCIYKHGVIPPRYHEGIYVRDIGEPQPPLSQWLGVPRRNVRK